MIIFTDYHAVWLPRARARRCAAALSALCVRVRARKAFAVFARGDNHACAQRAAARLWFSSSYYWLLWMTPYAATIRHHAIIIAVPPSRYFVIRKKKARRCGAACAAVPCARSAVQKERKSKNRVQKVPFFRYIFIICPFLSAFLFFFIIFLFIFVFHHHAQWYLDIDRETREVGRCFIIVCFSLLFSREYCLFLFLPPYYYYTYYNTYHGWFSSLHWI